MRNELDLRRREQTPQALARLVLLGLFIGLWGLLLVARIPAPLPFLLVLAGEGVFVLALWRAMFILPTPRAVQRAGYVMLAGEIVAHTAIVYFLGGIAWMGVFAYVFGLIFTNAFLDLKGGLVYTTGIVASILSLTLLEANEIVPHQTFLTGESTLYMDHRYMATTLIAGSGVFYSISLWVNWVGQQVRRQRDAANEARIALLDAYARLEERVRERTDELQRVNSALQESQRSLTTLMSNLPGMAYRCRNDRDWTMEFVSEGCYGLTGYRPGQLVGNRELSFNDLIHPDDREQVWSGVQAALARREPYRLTYRIRAASGQEKWVWEQGRGVFDDADELVALEGFLADVTERIRFQQALEESEQRYRDLFENANDLIYTHDLAGRFTSINRAAERITGYSREEALNANIVHLLSPEHLEVARQNIVRRGNEDTPGAYEIEIIAKDGRRIPLEVSTRVMYRDGKPIGMQGIARDITERKEAERLLRERARRDALTGVLNHGAITETLADLLARRPEDAPLAVAMVDVDGLKTVNDTYGHQAGDAVLVEVARALERGAAIVGRYGGDEFLAILPAATRAEAEGYRDAVMRNLAAASTWDAQTDATIPVVATVGIAVCPEEAGTVADLVRLSDSAMYAARRERPATTSEDGLLTGGLGRERAATMLGVIVPLLTSAGDVGEKFRKVASRLSAGAGYDAVDLYWWDPATDEPIARAVTMRGDERLAEAWSSEPGGEIMDVLASAHRPVILDDPRNDSRLAEGQREIMRAAGLRSGLVVPLVWRGRMAGILSVASRRENAFGPRDAHFLMAVATQVTAIACMETLLDQLQRTSSDLARAQAETVMMLAAAAEARDHVTGRHLQNIQTLTESLAREMGYREDDVRALGLASVLHDIGKIRVPDHVLASDGPLSRDAWDVVKQHTAWGGDLLEGRRGFELAAAVARCHHERWDGGGYPAGLKGEDIPEPASIVSVADAFDAMTSDRPYRARMSAGEAVNEIAACSGTQFNPRVVQAMLSIHRRGDLKAPDDARSRAA